MSSPVAVILEQLAATSWFAAHGEVALTAGLAFCLEKDRAAAQAFITLIRDRTGQSVEALPSPNRWQAELPDDDRLRLDIAGLLNMDEVPAPVLLVEAKVGATFAPRQVSTYVLSQKLALSQAGVTCGAFVVLVPGSRVRATREEVGADLESLGVTAGDQAWVLDGSPAVTVTVISWDEAIGRMLAKAEAAACDLEQLLGACRALQGADVMAFTVKDLAGTWRDRKDDLRLIIDRVTREATATLTLRHAPWQAKSSGGLDGGYRYLAPPDLPNLAVGMRLDDGSSPLWVRWHWRTADIKKVRIRLTNAGHKVQDYVDHLWLPLELEPDVGSSTRQIESLVSQVVELYKTAVAWSDPV
jgi:hypothetical protein